MADNKLLENLIKTLQYEYKAYSAILKIAEKKTDYLIKNDIDGLTKITEEEKATAEKTAQLNSVREQLIARFCEENSQNYKAFTVTKLIEQVNGPLRSQLEDIKTKLSDVIARVSARNGINQKLTENAVKYIDFNMQLISSPGPAVPTYGRTGHEVSNTPKKSVLDLKY